MWILTMATADQLKSISTEKTLLLLSIKPDYQLVQAVQMSLQV